MELLNHISAVIGAMSTPVPTQKRTQKEQISVFAAPRLQLTLTSVPNKSHLPISLNERKKQ
jgi:hypothetical protein